MKIIPINYNISYNNPFAYKGTKYATDVLSCQSRVASNTDDYSSVKEYYDEKMKKDGKLFDNPESLNSVLNNPVSKNQLFRYLKDHAQEEMLKIYTKPNPSADDLADFEAMKEIKQVFSDLDSESLNGANISFGAQKLTKEQRHKCHAAIHAASALCASISAIAGEGAAIGADTPFLRGTQFLMFLYLQKLLGIDTFTSLLYAGRQYAMGAVLGVRAAQYIIGWVGLGSSVATGGSMYPAVSPAVRGVNSALSTLITEKMGWGYVKSYENDSMTLQSQLLTTSLYAVTAGLFHYDDNGVLDPSNIGDVSAALKHISRENIGILGGLYDIIVNYANLPRLGVVFVTNFLQAAVTTRKMDEASKKEYFKNLLKTSLFNTAVYDVLDITENTFITGEAQDAVAKIAFEMKNTPVVFEEFNKIYQDLIDNIHLDDLSTSEFINQFKSRSFTTNMAYNSNEAAILLADTWRKKNLLILKNARKKLNKDKDEIKKHSEILRKNMTPEMLEEINATNKEIMVKFHENLRQNTRANFAMNQIAGYDVIKYFLNANYIQLIKDKNFDSLPNTMLFYGPSGMGKSLSAKAVAQAAGVSCQCKSNMRSDEDVMKYIESKLENASKGERHTIIQLDEFDDTFYENPEYLKKFIDIINDCAKKYKTTFILTTNDPLCIHPDILKSINLKFAFHPPEDDDIKEIIKFYINNNDVIKKLDFDMILNEINRHKPDAYYSVSQIKDIITKKLPRNNCTQEDIILAFRNTNPCIKKDVYDKFVNEINILNSRG